MSKDTPPRSRAPKRYQGTTQADLLPELRRDFPALFVGCLSVCVWPGWIELVRDLAAELTRNAPTAKIRQIKSKHGELVVCGTNSQGLIEKFAERSRRTCEMCGAVEKVCQVERPGPARRSWIWTICPDCGEKL